MKPAQRTNARLWRRVFEWCPARDSALLAAACRAGAVHALLALQAMLCAEFRAVAQGRGTRIERAAVHTAADASLRDADALRARELVGVVVRAVPAASCEGSGCIDSVSRVDCARITCVAPGR